MLGATISLEMAAAFAPFVGTPSKFVLDMKETSSSSFLKVSLRQDLRV
jgi:hypothetical protein